MLSNTKIGDKVIVHSMWGSRVSTIQRVTKCYVIVGGTKYHKENGQSPYYGCNSTSITIATLAELESMRKEAYVKEIYMHLRDKLRLENLSYEQAVDIAKILDI